MRMSFRWFDPLEPVPLQHIRQIPCVESVVSALYDIPVGVAWQHARVAALQAEIESGRGPLFHSYIPPHLAMPIGFFRRVSPLQSCTLARHAIRGCSGMEQWKSGPVGC